MYNNMGVLVIKLYLVLAFVYKKCYLFGKIVNFDSYFSKMECNIISFINKTHYPHLLV